MALILNIDTATEHASVCLSVDAQMLALASNTNQKDHAAFIQPAIQKILATTNYQLPSIDAIAVSNGPGSYTGLRVGLSTAKGLAYALSKPLILINTLEIIATAAILQEKENANDLLFCPMVDARRMEVFTAVYTSDLKEVVAPTAMILDENSFSSLLSDNKIIFSGSGAKKFGNIISNSNTKFSHLFHDASHMQSIAEKMYLLKSFADKAYSEPFYLKEFFTPQSNLKSD